MSSVDWEKDIPSPNPERVTQISCVPGEPIVHGKTLAIGVKLLTHNITGLKIVPEKHVVISIGDEEFPLQSGMARSLAQRVIDFCDIIERGTPQ